jgi:hypothetical protein
MELFHSKNLEWNGSVLPDSPTKQILGTVLPGDAVVEGKRSGSDGVRRRRHGPGRREHAAAASRPNSFMSPEGKLYTVPGRPCARAEPEPLQRRQPHHRAARAPSAQISELHRSAAGDAPWIAMARLSQVCDLAPCAVAWDGRRKSVGG